MITYNQIQEFAEIYKIADSIVEKDYFIELLMTQMSVDGLFKESIVFRGGTAVKKAYFEDYRFSEDIDFIIFEKDKLDYFREILKRTAENINNEFSWNLKIRSKIDNERLQAFISYDIIPEIKAIKELKIDIVKADNNPAYKLMKMKFIYDDYKNRDIRLNTYRLEAVISDKMSRIISGNKEARDIYDIWKLIRLDLDIQLIKKEFKNTMGYGMDVNAIIQHMKSEVFKKTWKTRLETQVPGLPGYNTVMAELESLMIAKLA